MATDTTPPEPDLPNIRKHLRAPRPLWRLFGWGSTATIALAAVALTSQTEAGAKRLQLAIAYVSEPVRAVAQIPPRAAEPGAETQHLAAQLRDLAADRERLTARIAMLERNLADMTGSIKQQTERLAAARAAMSPAPAVSPPAATQAIASAAPALTPLAPPVTIVTAPPAPAANRPPHAAETRTEPVPMPPARMAAAPMSAPAAGSAPAAKTEFGIDLGGAVSLEALRQHWATMKANYGPLLAGLRPLAAQHPKQQGGFVYRLVVGPLPNILEATKLCGRFPVTRIGCHAAKFDGAQLAEH